MTPSADIFTDAWQTAEDIRAGQVTSVEVVTRSLALIHDLQPALNAYTIVLDESALASARAAMRPYAGEGSCRRCWAYRSR